jgi:N-terminal domain of galactosyltransferase
MVCSALRAALPGFPLLLVDSGHETFNRAASRNLGVRRADPDEIVVVCDADTLPEPAPLANAVASAYSGRLHYPFTTCHYLTEAGTELVLQGQLPDSMRIEFSILGAQGGIFVMRAGAWLEVGGMDERFAGWGYEDNAWHTAVARTIGQPIRHEGVAWHLWHPAERYCGTPDEVLNLERARRAAS